MPPSLKFYNDELAGHTLAIDMRQHMVLVFAVIMLATHINFMLMCSRLVALGAANLPPSTCLPMLSDAQWLGFSLDHSQYLPLRELTKVRCVPRQETPLAVQIDNLEVGGWRLTMLAQDPAEFPKIL